jgi:hypothetical protein
MILKFLLVTYLWYTDGDVNYEIEEIVSAITAEMEIT